MGFDGASVRSIASAAAVDPALIYHFFRSKRELYETAIDVPPDPSDRFRHALRGPGDGGEGLVRAFLEIWDAPAGASALQIMLRSGSTDADAQATLAGLITRSLIAPASAAVDARRSMPRLRAGLVAAQLTGLAWLRYVLRVEPVASASPAIVAKTYGPSVSLTLSGTDYGN